MLGSMAKTYIVKSELVFNMFTIWFPWYCGWIPIITNTRINTLMLRDFEGLTEYRICLTLLFTGC